jgi:hypothetical protein
MPSMLTARCMSTGVCSAFTVLPKQQQLQCVREQYGCQFICYEQNKTDVFVLYILARAIELSATP